MGSGLNAVRIVAESLAGRSINQRKESVDWALLTGNTMALYFDQGAVELIGQAKEGLIEFGMPVSGLLFGAIILLFESLPAVGQANHILRVGIEGHRMGLGLNRAKGPDQGLQFQLGGGGLLKPFKLHAGF